MKLKANETFKKRTSKEIFSLPLNIFHGVLEICFWNISGWSPGCRVVLIILWIICLRTLILIRKEGRGLEKGKYE